MGWCLVGVVVDLVDGDVLDDLVPADDDVINLIVGQHVVVAELRGGAEHVDVAAGLHVPQIHDVLATVVVLNVVGRVTEGRRALETGVDVLLDVLARVEDRAPDRLTVEPGVHGGAEVRVVLVTRRDGVLVAVRRAAELLRPDDDARPDQVLGREVVAGHHHGGRDGQRHAKVHLGHVERVEGGAVVADADGIAHLRVAGEGAVSHLAGDIGAVGTGKKSKNR